MVAVEPPFKALPTETLCVVIAPERFHYREAHLLPFEGNPAASAFVYRVDRGPGLLQTARVEKPTSDFRGYAWYGSRFLALLRDECINIALGIGNFLQRQANDTLVSRAGDFVSIEGTAGAPANHFTVLCLSTFLAVPSPRSQIAVSVVRD